MAIISSVLLFIAGAVDEDDRAVLAKLDDAFEQLGYTAVELGQITRFAKIYVDEQMRIFRSILDSLDIVKQWHKHLHES